MAGRCSSVGKAAVGSGRGSDDAGISDQFHYREGVPNALIG